jgi:hypothetical protein
LFALSSTGAKTDAVRLSALTQARGGRLVPWQGRGGVETAARMLLEQGTRIVAVEGDGIEDLQPEAWDVDGGMIRIAGRMTDASANVRVTLREAGKTRTIEIPVQTDAADAQASSRVAALWAAWRIAGMGEDGERHRAQIARMGQRFGIVTPGTSLLVLEAAEDYVRYDIPAPPALRERVAELKRSQRTEREQTRAARLDEVAARFQARLDWWQRPPAKPTNSESRAVRPKAVAKRCRAARMKRFPHWPRRRRPPHRRRHLPRPRGRNWIGPSSSEAGSRRIRRLPPSR